MRQIGYLALGFVVAAFAVVLDPAAGDARGRGEKRSEVHEIIVHATGGPSCKSGTVVFSPAGELDRLKMFFERSTAVSIHYIVDRNGAIAKSVPEDEIAFHAINHNDRSIGIELINAGDGREPFPPEQINALATLIQGIQKRWRIPLADVKGHDEVDTTTFRCGGRLVRRKQDPGVQFPWDRFKQRLLMAGTPDRSGAKATSTQR
jgi:N-acetylmuramoyl-L-alanine amidase